MMPFSASLAVPSPPQAMTVSKPLARRFLDLLDRAACMGGCASLNLHASRPQNFLYARDVLLALVATAS